MVKITLENSYSYIEDFQALDLNVKSIISKTLSYFNPSARYSIAYKRGNWDGRVSVLDKKGRFPTGLLSKLCKALGSIPYKLHDQRSKPLPQIFPKWNKQVVLRDYQEDILEHTEHYFRGIYEIPTRTGKTFVAAALIHKFQQRSILFVNTAESMREAHETLSKCLLGVSIGRYGGGKKEDGDIIVGMMPSVYRNPSILENRGLFIVDEVHLAGADSWYETLLKSDAYYRFGQSGTVFREDAADIKFFANTGPLFYKVPIQAMWDEDIIMKPKIHWVKFPSPNIHATIQFANTYRLGIVDNEERNLEIVKLVKKHKNQATLVSVESINHLHNIRLLLEKAKIEHVMIHGDSKTREEDYQDFKSGKVRCAVASRVLNTSVTLPDLAVLINAAGKKSEVELMQKIGRILGKGNKSEVIVYDFVDSQSKTLLRHSKTRHKALKAAGYEQIGW